MKDRVLEPFTASPKMTKSEEYVRDLLAQAGIVINGDRPSDMQVYEPTAISRPLAEGSIGLGEEYMNGSWDAGALDEFFYKLLRSGVVDEVNPASIIFHSFVAKFVNRQTKKRAWDVGERHYDLGNDFYQKMLDSRMAYTCGYWRDATTLEEAQEAKLDLICRKLKLAPGMKLLDIGCGWGSLMAFAAENYGVECVGVTISKEQAEWGRERYSHLPIEFRLQDYRDLSGQFDRIASVGMFEHVGRKNHRTFMEVAHGCIKQDGLMLLHTIGKNLRDSSPDAWIDKYIFPNGDLPSLGQIGDALDGLFIAEDLHNFGADYDKTLMAWCSNFERNWPEFYDLHGGRFYRMWRYYLLACAGAFRARDIQLWQWVISPRGVVGGYARVT